MNQKIKISQLPAKGSNLAAQDLLEIAEFTGTGYISKSITGQELIDAIPAPTGFVPDSRTLTINGTTQDLSADRTFTISTGITIGTTAITSGTVGRVLFQGTGNVVQQSSSLFWDATNNRLGIGTSTPLSTLDINLGAGSLSNSVSIRNSSSTGYSAVTLFDNRNSNSFVGQWGLYGTSHPTLPSGMYYYNTAGGNIGFFTGSGTPSADIRMMLTASGNTLIGTTTDAGFRLDVNGTARVQSTLGVNGSVTANTASSGTGYEGYKIQDGANARFVAERLITNFLGIGHNSVSGRWDDVLLGSAQRLYFYTGASERMRIFSTGNVGINTTTDAGFRLDVNGSMRATTMRSDNPVIGFAPSTAGVLIGSNQTYRIICDGSTYYDFRTNAGVIYRLRDDGSTSFGSNTIAASAMVDIQSTTKGFLPPRMTTTQKNAIATPAAGLMVYDTTLNVISYYNGSMWI